MENDSRPATDCWATPQESKGAENLNILLLRSADRVIMTAGDSHLDRDLLVFPLFTHTLHLSLLRNRLSCKIARVFYQVR